MTTTAPERGSSRVQIRSAEQADLVEVVRIEQQSFPQPWPFQAFDGFLGEPAFLVAAGCSLSNTDSTTPVIDTRITGFVVADIMPQHRGSLGHIKDLAVHPNHRRQGIGTRLLNRALSTLATEGARQVKLEVRKTNEQARALYDQFGFEPRRIVPRYYADGEDAIVLVTTLQP